MCVVPLFTAMLSSPLSIQLCATVTLVEFPGSIPSVFRASYFLSTGVSRCTPQAVNPLVPFTLTWKLGELCRVIRYSTSPSA
jgi:hypothetical protein